MSISNSHLEGLSFLGQFGEFCGDFGESVRWFCPFLSLFVCSCADDTEPGWVEVMVEILLSLLTQPSLLIRRISKSVFVRICPNLTKRGLQLILDVSEALNLENV